MLLQPLRLAVAQLYSVEEVSVPSGTLLRATHYNQRPAEPYYAVTFAANEMLCKHIMAESSEPIPGAYFAAYGNLSGSGHAALDPIVI